MSLYLDFWWIALPLIGVACLLCIEYEGATEGCALRRLVQPKKENQK